MISILGAGLSGLIAATQIPDAVVFESNDSGVLSHRAVLRFRSDALSRLTGIPFRQVTVRKSIWYEGCHCLPNIALANMYSEKTNGQYLDRSIWNVDPVQRFIAPEDLQQQMAEMIGPRIKWSRPVTHQMLSEMPGAVISTLPMPVLLGLLEGVEEGEPEFKHKSILVDRYRVKGANVFQTIYYPSRNFAAYRASITGDLLIVERSGELRDDGLNDIRESFGIGHYDLKVIDESHTQRFGKIAPIDDRWRRDKIFKLTRDRNIYSLGRFAVWRNILLDDVCADVAVIKRLINLGHYGAAIQHSKEAK